ncbi:DUF2799 domain-containing protein [Photobacterium rosenbergii]|nr:DUF2799 domain-containing protein [Photobacterium rosenbergii]
MKRLFTALSIVVLSACSSTENTYSNIDNWDEHGYRTGLSGEVAKQESKFSYADKDNYNEYLNGYKRGQQAYCEQDAYLLGLTSQPYKGVCDEIDNSFAFDYQLGLSQIRDYGSNLRDNINRSVNSTR